MLTIDMYPLLSMVFVPCCENLHTKEIDTHHSVSPWTLVRNIVRNFKSTSIIESIPQT